jgi:SAM-dependent methyltransferase
MGPSSLHKSRLSALLPFLYTLRLGSIGRSLPFRPSAAFPDHFDPAADYDRVLNQGLCLSGEDKHFFIAGRVADLKNQFPTDYAPKRILDFGCGTGDTATYLADSFPSAQIVGVDISPRSLAFASARYGSERVSFRFAAAAQEPKFDLCYCNGVFHHIAPPERAAALSSIEQALAPGGYFALFENNPWNVGALMVMKRISFDRGTVPISPAGARRLVESCGLRVLSTRYLFYFPRPLSFLRAAEPSLARLPLGAQYYVLARKD